MEQPLQRGIHLHLLWDLLMRRSRKLTICFLEIPFGSTWYAAIKSFWQLTWHLVDDKELAQRNARSLLFKSRVPLDTHVYYERCCVYRLKSCASLRYKQSEITSCSAASKELVLRLSGFYICLYCVNTTDEGIRYQRSLICCKLFRSERLELFHILPNAGLKFWGEGFYQAFFVGF